MPAENNSRPAPAPTPSAAPGPRSALLGAVLVAAQFAVLAVLLLRAAAYAGPPGGWVWALAAGAGALGLWTLAHNRPGNFRIHPHPHPQGHLVTSGPYRWVRHPMYGAVLLLAAALAGVVADRWSAGLWLLLLGVLDVKARLEERCLRARFADYGAYGASTGRFFPRGW